MTEDISQLLREGIAAARAGDKTRAKRLLIEVTEKDERNEEAWLWLSGVVEDLEEIRICLENVLAINPHNQRARKGLAWVASRLAAERPAPPPPERPAPPPAPWSWETAPTEEVEPPPAERPTATPAPEPPPGEWETRPAPESAFPPERPSFEEEVSPPFVLPGQEAPVEEEVEAVPPGDRVACPACGTLNFDFATECVKCGFPFAITCPECSELVATDTGFCPQCGAQLPLPAKLPAVRAREAEIENAYRRGLALLKEKRYQEAKEALEQVIAQDPHHVEAYYNLGVACARLGLRDEARQHWQMVQQLQPDHPYVQQELDSLLSPRERRRLALERRRAEQEAQKKARAKRGQRPGQTLLYEYEQKLAEKPAPEEEVSGLESFLYILLVGIILGVSYALNPQAYGLQPLLENAPGILEQTLLVVILVFLAWLVLGLVARLLSLIFRARGRTSAYMVCSSHLLMPFFLLSVPIALYLPPVTARLP
ncbi:MAG: tetratricopeptide repeat protein, partial [Chloroflexia bacterium]